jgi:ribosome biogenesis protein ENP2
MNVQNRNGVNVYCLSSSSFSAGNLPEWSSLGDRARRNLSKIDEGFRRRIELLQDFSMPASSNKLVQSSDARYIIAAGTYPPRIRCYDVHELSMKFERYVDSHVVDVVTLGEDYGKLALLLEDRSIAFHAHYGHHTQIRIPKHGRAMAYEPTTCDLLVASSDPNNTIYRVNLDEGRFFESWQSPANNVHSDNAASNCIAVHPMHPCAAIGCDDGKIRFWDSRVSAQRRTSPFVTLDVESAVSGRGYASSTGYSPSVAAITALAWDDLYMTAGTQRGVVALYDVRSSKPLFVMEHKHGLPIHTVRFHKGSGMVLSADEALVKIWRYKSKSHNESGTSSQWDNPKESSSSTAMGSVHVNIEGSNNAKFSNFIVAGDEADSQGNASGLILCTTDQPKMDSFYVPSIGVAPRWCSYLENITEELQERDIQRSTDSNAPTETVFENYKFVTREDLEKLGISHLIGTPLLRGYMHGFFMDANLYNRVKAVANPFEYEEYQKKKLRERLEAKRASRIAPRKTTTIAIPAVNPDLAERLEIKATGADPKAGKIARGLLSDDRFGTLFTNPDFEIDTEDPEFKLRNPSGVASAKRKKENMDSDDEDDVNNENTDDVQAVIDHSGAPDDHGQDEHSWDGRSSGSHDDDDSDDDEFGTGKVKGEAYEAMKELEQKLKQQEKDYNRRKNKSSETKKSVKIEIEDLDDNELEKIGDVAARNFDRTRRQQEVNMPLGMRKAMQNDKLDDSPQVRTLGGGSKEVTFLPRNSKRKKEEQQHIRGKGQGVEPKDQRNRRGVNELKLKRPFRPRR